MTLQINLDKACTICLQETSLQTSIFDCIDDEISIQAKIIKCFPSFEQVRLKYEFPDKICCGCAEDVNAAFRFQNNCEHTVQLLLRCTVVQEQEQTVVEKQSSDEAKDISTIDTSLEENNTTEFEEYSEVEHNDCDYVEPIVVEDIVIEETKSQCNENSNIILNIKSEVKDQILKRFKSKIKPNHENNQHTNKTNKKLTTLKNTPKICELCGNSYKYQHALKAHMRRHLNDRPFKCEFCEKKFVSNVELRRHMRVHTGQKPYACSYCERCFSDFGSRIKHERTHTGERPFVCETCNKSFAYAHVLTVHLRTHSGEKKFKCTDCGRGFTKKAYLIAHMQQHGQSAEIAAKDKEIHNTLKLERKYLDGSKETVDKCAVKLMVCSKCGAGFSKKSTMALHMERCNVENTGMSELKNMENLDESLEECITAYIIEEIYEENNEHLENLKDDGLA